MTSRQTLMPRHLGPYTVEQVLGSGSMGVVVRAVHTQLERAVALKVLHPGLLQDPDALRRFLREARAIARIEHPNVVSVYDAGEIDGVYYIAMKLLEGESLKALLARTGPLPPDRIISIGVQIAAGLDYAHARGVVHLDVKPANVMVADNGHVALTDFGIAQALSPGATQSVVTVGTPLYMSPEQILGQAVDGRSDVYSLGLVLYEMSTGQPPFQGTCAGVMHAHVNTPAPDLRARAPSLPEDLVAVIHRALVKDPAGRFHTARQLQRALEDCAPTNNRRVGPGTVENVAGRGSPVRDATRGVSPASSRSHLPGRETDRAERRPQIPTGELDGSAADRTAVLRGRSASVGRGVGRWALALLVAGAGTAILFHHGAPAPATAVGVATASPRPAASPSWVAPHRRIVYGFGRLTIVRRTPVPRAIPHRKVTIRREVRRSVLPSHGHASVSRRVTATRRPAPRQRPLPSPTATATPFPTPTVQVYRPVWRQDTHEPVRRQLQAPATPVIVPKPTAIPRPTFIPVRRATDIPRPVPSPVPSSHVSSGVGLQKTCDPEVEAC